MAWLHILRFGCLEFIARHKEIQIAHKELILPLACRVVNGIYESSRHSTSFVPDHGSNKVQHKCMDGDLHVAVLREITVHYEVRLKPSMTNGSLHMELGPPALRKLCIRRQIPGALEFGLVHAVLGELQNLDDLDFK